MNPPIEKIVFIAFWTEFFMAIPKLIVSVLGLLIEFELCTLFFFFNIKFFYK